jgi:hypoxanthine phosphoribosyltransferase
VKSCGALNVEFYTGIGTVLEAPALLPPDLDLGYLPGKRVLLVDDVADSGRTLALAVKMLRDAEADVRSVCIHTKPGSVAPPTSRGARPTAGSTSLVGAARSPRRTPARRRAPDGDGTR